MRCRKGDNGIESLYIIVPLTAPKPSSKGFKMTSDEVEITYLTLHLRSYKFLESPSFQAILKENPNLVLVRATINDENEEVWSEVTLPIDIAALETYDRCVGVIDKDLEDPIANVLRIHDFDAATVVNPSESFIKILKLIEKEWDLVEINMFVSNRDKMGDDTSVWGEIFDFTTGNYIPGSTK